MNATIKGTVSGLQSGDAVTLIEVVWKLGAETEAQAQAAGRGVNLTSAGDIAAFQAAGYALTSANLVEGTTYTSAVRVTESRAGAGAYAGTWGGGGTFVASPLILNLNATKGDGANTPNGNTPTTWTDLSPSSLAMALGYGGAAGDQTAMAQWYSGAIDYCTFPQTDDGGHLHGSIPTVAAICPAKITIELVLRFNTAVSGFNTDYPGLLMKYQGYGDNKGYGLFIEKATNTLFWRFYSNGAWRDSTPSIASIASDTTNFHHICCGFDGRYSRVYLDGAELLNAGSPWVDLGAGANYDILQHTTATLALGGTLNGSSLWGAHSHLDVAALRIYNRMLSPAEVSANYTNKYTVGL
ncbi:MAG: hypothetical protein A2075_09055 [Geobacteraceae bacterium GWC2_58_44]|nr:MAG: hypothetical protein A2075_09055 [Geobacteraceae bacterium GWC2_58_44]HBG07661.1 hypothetical protein [Geobacter sp.]